jgi:hypothetical protein
MARHTNPDEVDLGLRYITREFPPAARITQYQCSTWGRKGYRDLGRMGKREELLLQSRVARSDFGHRLLTQTSWIALS